MRSDLNRTVTVVHHGERQYRAFGIDVQYSGAGPDLARDHGIGEVIVTSLRPSGKVAST